jgi:hypothetical protein
MKGLIVYVACAAQTCVYYTVLHFEGSATHSLHQCKLCGPRPHFEIVYILLECHNKLSSFVFFHVLPAIVGVAICHKNGWRLMTSTMCVTFRRLSTSNSLRYALLGCYTMYLLGMYHRF